MGNKNIDMKVLINRVKTNNYIPKQNLKENKPKNLSMRDMLKITRSLNETFNILPIDQATHEKGIKTALNGLKAIPTFNKIELVGDSIFWSGMINDMIAFVYKISSDGSKDGVEFDYDEKLNVGTPETDEIIKAIEDYYNTFFEYYQNN